MWEILVPWLSRRVTQFDTLMDIFLGGRRKLPRLATVPFKWQFQPVDTSDVAARLVEVVTGEPAGMLPVFGGPEGTDFKRLATSWPKTRKPNKPLIKLWLPFTFSRQFAARPLLCPSRPHGTVTYEQDQSR